MPKLDTIPLGTKMGRLLLIEETARLGTKRNVSCRCDCGKSTTVLWQNLKRGATTSCGCYAREINTTHGASRTRPFQIWSNMLGRCYRPSTQAYPYYGGQGITVCEDWHDFKTFNRWAEQNGYADHLTIERRDTRKNYDPNNCYWADLNTQAANKSKRRGSSTPYIGVSKWGNSWAAHITQRGYRLRIGVFSTPEDAKNARNAYIKKHQLPHTLS